jgi:7-carboxy-7-deazaguanine synthase
MLWKNFTENLSNNDVLKFVVGTKEDLDDMKHTVQVVENSSSELPHIFVSPIFGMIDPKDIVEYLKDNDLFNVRMQLQIHKFIWPSDMKGV